MRIGVPGSGGIEPDYGEAVEQCGPHAAECRHTAIFCQGADGEWVWKIGGGLVK